ncbi:MAG: SusC/RagA family TonB-linked outer membrane protein [Ferruginibacter sp.]
MTGKIVDDKGNGVPAASIKVSNSSAGTSTENDGTFSIKADNSTILTVSSSGYETQTITVGTQIFVGAILKTTNTALQEIIVNTTLGQQQRKSALGTATASVKSKELTQGRSTNLAQGLAAKVTGVNIQQTNSGVNQDTRITLRGIRSLTGNNQPMLILDGIPLSLGYFASINPNDIADITILKSATSTAVYGPDGVNGAIVVTTKKGSKLKPNITLSHSTQFETISYLPQFQNRWGSGYDQDPATGQGTYTAFEQQSWGDEFDGSIRTLGEAGPQGQLFKQKYSYLPNERRNFFNTGVTNQTDVSYSTGDFYLSGQNVSIKGTLPGDELSRRTATFRSEKEYNRFKAIFNLRYTQTRSNTTTANSTVYYGVTGAPGNVPLSRFADWRNDYFSSPDGYYTTYLANFDLTPYFAKDNNRQVGKTDDVFGNVEFNYKASKSLNFVYRVGLTITNADATATRGAFTSSDFYLSRPSGPSRKVIAGAVTDANNYSNRLTSEFFANYNKSVGKFDIIGLLGYSFRESRTKGISVGSNNLGQSQFLSISTRLGEPTVGLNNSLARLQRFFGKVGFNYDRKIYVEATGSYDQDSRLVPADKIFDTKRYSYFYPGINTSILLHEFFPSLKENKVLNFIQIRGAIAKSANANLAPYQNEVSFGSGTFFPYGTTPGYQIGTTVFPKNGLTPEFVNTKEFGIELGFLKKKITLEANYYTQNNSDQILNASLSNTTGANSTLLNAGAFNNKGYEFDLTLNDLVKFGEVGFDFKIGYVKQSSKITSLVDGVDELGIGNFNFAVVGQPAYVFKVTDYNRDPASGKVIVSRTTGLPTLTNAQVQVGNTLPTDILNLNLNMNWKNISVAIVGQYSTGNKIIADQLGQFLDDNGISKRSGDFGRRAFVFPNSVYDDGTGKFVNNTNVFTQSYGRLFYNDNLNTNAITNYLADGSFFKLREVSLTYTFPSSLFTKSALKGVTAGFSGRNLLTWLPNSNQWTDPEFTSNGNNAFTGNATGRSTAFNLPPTRFMGANVTFQF